jgi:Family of unknown function (DUF5681)
MKFEPGQSGNPAGKPRGARNKTTVAMEALLDGEAEIITKKAIELAKAGDGLALRLCIERIFPPRKDRPVEFDLPELKTASDAVAAHGAIVAAVSKGELTPSEASDIGQLVGNFARAFEISELEERIRRLEAATGTHG